MTEIDAVKMGISQIDNDTEATIIIVVINNPKVPVNGFTLSFNAIVDFEDTMEIPLPFEKNIPERPLGLVVLRAYPNNPEPRNVMMAQTR